MSSSANTIVLSDDSSNDSSSASSKPQAQAVRPTKNIAVKRGMPNPQSQSQAQVTVPMKSKRDLEVINSSSNFLDNFNPLTSRREKNKRKQFVGPKVVTKKYYTPLYDEQGRLKSTNQDVCDCFDVLCAGCHFPCYYCNSQKCASKCRNNRRFMYEAIEYDGKDTVLTNPLLANST
ncbi:hypothetical protein PVAND_010871 [Polypedilum vanderplanki]|uniref:ARF7 effector protein C-terminal domain-containing protein n=1 Tax=Polypedilum vanderplanki TaxID=319348 RepID=A0A9J6CI73_POLVA|nr:hypothetical protein PVAND_010871 [Polypedilum vanderplanki]